MHRAAGIALGLAFMFFVLWLPATLSAQDDSGRDALGTAYEHFEAGRYRETIEALTPVAATDDPEQSARMHRLLGLAFFELGQKDDARQALAKALSTGRWTPDVIARLAQIDRERGRTEAALAGLRLMVFLRPGEASWRIALGGLLADAGRTEEALTIIERLIEDRPANAQLRLRLAALRHRRGATRQALLDYTTAWHLGARRTDVARTIAGLHRSLDDDAQALAWLEQIEDAADGELSPDDRRLAFRLRGRIARREGRIDEAARHVRRALDLGDTDPSLHAFLGTWHYNAGRFEKAADRLAHRLDAGQPDRDLHRLLLTALIETNDRDALRRWLVRYVAWHGTDGAVREAVGRLAR